MPNDTNEAEIAKKGSILQRMIAEGTKSLGKVSQSLNAMLGSLESMIEPFSKIQSAAIDLGKAVGFAGQSIMTMTERMIAQNKALSLSMNYNISSEEMFKLTGQVLSKIGRNIAIDNVERVYKNEKGEVVDKGFGGSEIENLVAARTVFGDDVVSDIVAGFDKVGKSMNSATKAAGKLFKQASDYGINASLYAKNFTSNLAMAQRYNFRDGVRGLQEMARKATEIRQDMSQISRFAEKVGTVEGAIETASRLQVLGASFAGLANPLAMLNESLTDMGSLQERFNKMTKNAAYYDASRKEVRMDPLERMKLIRAAEAMGVDANNVLEQAFSQARIGEVKSQMQGYTFSDEVAKMLPNIATIDSETGMAGATIDGKFRTLSQISGDPELQKKLIEETRTESEDIKVIAKSVMGIKDMLEGRSKQISNEAALNKIKPGVLGGVSTLEAVVDTLVNAIDNRAISAAGKMDFPFKETESVAISAAFGSLVKFGKAFDATSLSEGQAMLSKAIEDTFGKEGTLPVAMQSAMEAVTKFFDGFTKKANEFMKETLGAEFLETTKAAGTDKIPNGEAVITATDAVSPTRRFEAITGNPIYQPFFASPMIIDGLDEAFKESVNMWRSNAFKPNDKTMPSETVSKPAAQDTTGQATQNGSGEYTINLNGTLSMDVNGDNGKIGTIDIVQLLKDNNGLMSEFSRMVSEAIEKIDKQGARKNSQ